MCQELFNQALAHCENQNSFDELENILRKFNSKRVGEMLPRPGKKRKIEKQKF